MHAHLNIALRAARDAAEAIAHASDRLDRIKIIDKQPESFLTSMDQEADNTIHYHLKKAFPSHAVHSRVSGHHPGENGEPTWLVDPLVGSRNFFYGYPQFGVSIAKASEGMVTHAVLVSPLIGDEFTAIRGDGALLNSRRIRVAESKELLDTLIGVDQAKISPELFGRLTQILLQSGAELRQSGCSALDIVHVAAGRLNGGWCMFPNSLSLAAANLILTEAGGLVGNESGNPELEEGHELICGNPKIFKQLTIMRQRVT